VLLVLTKSFSNSNFKRGRENTGLCGLEEWAGPGGFSRWREKKNKIKGEGGGAQAG
jgi:hypothetical protein